jgi:hypothetical protein
MAVLSIVVAFHYTACAAEVPTVTQLTGGTSARPPV